MKKKTWNLVSREDFENLMYHILDPIRFHYTENKSGLKIGYTSAHYEETSALMEGFSRPLWALVPYFKGGGRDAEFEKLYQEGIINGTTPGGDGYWGRCHDYDQRFVEMAAISYAILAVPEIFWDPLTKKQKENFADWLYEINRHECCSCNWHFFRIMANMALANTGMKYDEQLMIESLDFIDSCYRDHGWYIDGECGQVDYYVPFGMQYYGVMYAMFMKEKDPVRSQRFIDRALLFGKEFLYWFSDNGSALPYGRSQVYRFAQCAFYSICIAAGIEPVSKAVMKGVIVRNLNYWMKQPIFDQAGLLTIGYAYPNLTMAESYNAPGSPYWSMKVFACMWLDKDDEFWKIRPEELPCLEPLKKLEFADMITQRVNGEVIAYPGGRLIERQHTHTEEKYSKFAYSTKYGFSVMHSQLSMKEAAPDSMLSFELFGHIYVRGMAHDFTITNYEITSHWSPIEGIEVYTRIIPTKNGHIRVHGITSSYDCVVHDAGFAVPMINEKGDMKGYGCRVTSLEGDGVIEDLIPEPNTNLLFSKTVIPMATYQIKKGNTIIKTQIEVD
jgi:hypothetical protein